jgi:UDP-N-acetyl-D-mannosaminuronate dehydrogenase
MPKQAFVIVAPVPLAADEASCLQMIKKAIQSFAENLTDEQIVGGVVDFPEGEGDCFLLPALVENPKVLKGPRTKP